MHTPAAVDPSISIHSNVYLNWHFPLFFHGFCISVPAAIPMELESSPQSAGGAASVCCDTFFSVSLFVLPSPPRAHVRAALCDATALPDECVTIAPSAGAAEGPENAHRTECITALRGFGEQKTQNEAQSTAGSERGWRCGTERNKCKRLKWGSGSKVELEYVECCTNCK